MTKLEKRDFAEVSDCLRADFRKKPHPIAPFIFLALGQQSPHLKSVIACDPTGLFSWNYQITMEEDQTGAVEFSTFREQAEIRVQREVFQVTKDGFMSGRWTLGQDDRTYATATKPNPFTRRFEVQSDRLAFELVPANILTRRFEFVLDSRIIGTITPAHAFTRRAVIDCTSRVPVQLQLFSLCLAVFIWRRAARSNANT